MLRVSRGEGGRRRLSLDSRRSKAEMLIVFEVLDDAEATDPEEP